MKVPDVTTRVANLGFRNAVIVIVKVETEEGITEVAETVMKPKTRSNRGIDIGVQALPGGEGSMGSRIAGEKMYRDPFWVGGADEQHGDQRAGLCAVEAHLHRDVTAQSDGPLASRMNLQFAATIANYLIRKRLDRGRSRSWRRRSWTTLRRWPRAN